MLRLIPTLARFQISAKTNRFHRDQNLFSHRRRASWIKTDKTTLPYSEFCNVFCYTEKIHLFGSQVLKVLNSYHASSNRIQIYTKCNDELRSIKFLLLLLLFVFLFYSLYTYTNIRG